MSEERKAAERLIATLIGILIAVIGIRFLLPVVWDKLSPFILATPLAAVLQPVIGFFQRKLKMKRTAASMIPVILVILILLGLIYWLLSFGISQLINALGNSGSVITDAVNAVRQSLDKILNAATHLSPEVETRLRSAIDDMVSKATAWGTDVAGRAISLAWGIATRLPMVLIYISFMAIGLYFIAKDYGEIRSYLPGGRRRRQDSNTTQLTNSAIRSLTGYLKVQGTFGLMTFVASWIYLQCFGFPYAGVIAAVAGVMEMIPMVGSGLLYIVWAIVAFILGKAATGIKILVLTGVLQLVRRLIEPKLMSNSIGISPLLSLIAMFAGMRFGGVLGLICGPVVMAVIVGAIRGKYFESVRRDLRCIASYFKRRWT